MHFGILKLEHGWEFFVVSLIADTGASSTLLDSVFRENIFFCTLGNKALQFGVVGSRSDRDRAGSAALFLPGKSSLFNTGHNEGQPMDRKLEVLGIYLIHVLC